MAVVKLSGRTIRWRNFQKKIKTGCQGFGPIWQIGYRKILFGFQTRFWIPKPKDSNTFELNLNWGQTKINLNKLFGGFSSLELLKISFNVQIQTMA
jgi:hypothetical protein